MLSEVVLVFIAFFLNLLSLNVVGLLETTRIILKRFILGQLCRLGEVL